MNFPALYPLLPKARPSARRQLIAQMAVFLRRRGVPSSEREAMRLLLAGPFKMGDVTALAGEALAEAQRQAGSPAMARPR